MRIGIPKESLTGETRVAASPETVKKLVGQGHTLVVAAGAGLAANFTAVNVAGPALPSTTHQGKISRQLGGFGPAVNFRGVNFLGGRKSHGA